MPVANDLNRSELLPSLTIVFAGATWGLFWLPLRTFEAAGIGSIYTSLLLYAVAILVILPWLVRDFSRFRREWMVAVGVGCFLGGSFSLYAVSLIKTEVVRALLLFYLSPVWSTLIAWLWFREQASVSRILAILLGLAGLLAVLDYRNGLPWPRNTGDWLAFTSGVIWAIGSTISYRRPPLGVAGNLFGFAAGGFISAGIMILIFGTSLGPLPQAGPLLAYLPAIAAMSALALVPSTIGLNWGVQRVDPGRVGILLMAELIVGTISAALLAAEPFGLKESVSVTLILAAALVEVFGKRRAGEPALG